MNDLERIIAKERLKNKELTELLSTFKSMFKDGKNDLYLAMINKLKTEIK